MTTIAACEPSCNPPDNRVERARCAALTEEIEIMLSSITAGAKPSEAEGAEEWLEHVAAQLRPVAREIGA